MQQTQQKPLDSSMTTKSRFDLVIFAYSQKISIPESFNLLCHFRKEKLEKLSWLFLLRDRSKGLSRLQIDKTQAFLLLFLSLSTFLLKPGPLCQPRLLHYPTKMTFVYARALLRFEVLFCFQFQFVFLLFLNFKFNSFYIFFVGNS